MAIFTVTIPDDQTPRVVAALCAAAGLPVSPENAQAAAAQWVATTVRNVEAALAASPPPVPEWVDPGVQVTEGQKA